MFVNYYNHHRYHESLNNLTPADVFYARGQFILDEREKIKRRSLAMQRQMYYDNQSTKIKHDDLKHLLIQTARSPNGFGGIH